MEAVNTLWLASFKVRVHRGSPIDFDGSDYMFGEAAGYAPDAHSFESKISPALAEGKLELLEIYNVSPADSASWVNDYPAEDKADVLNLIEEVKHTREFGFGAFRSSNFLKVHR